MTQYHRDLFYGLWVFINRHHFASFVKFIKLHHLMVFLSYFFGVSFHLEPCIPWDNFSHFPNDLSFTFVQSIWNLGNLPLTLWDCSLQSFLASLCSFLPFTGSLSFSLTILGIPGLSSWPNAPSFLYLYPQGADPFLEY